MNIEYFTLHVDYVQLTVLRRNTGLWLYSLLSMNKWRCITILNSIFTLQVCFYYSAITKNIKVHTTIFSIELQGMLISQLEELEASGEGYKSMLSLMNASSIESSCHLVGLSVTGHITHIAYLHTPYIPNCGLADFLFVGHASLVSLPHT